MENNIILISKDILRSDYLGIYGSKINKTPNINSLALSGTIFKNHYTAAPSSAMSYTSMFSGLFPHQLERKTYSKVEPFTQSATVFSALQALEYQCNIIWDSAWFKRTYMYSRVYGGDSTKFNNMEIGSHVGPHNGGGRGRFDEELINNTLDDILSKLKKILNNSEKNFIWIHLPHVLRGANCYGSDIEYFDKLVGKIMEITPPNSIYLTADHGHMNLERGIPVYGFHVYQGAIKIPLITPRINSKRQVVYPTSNTQLKDIILKGEIKQLPYIYSDSQYFLQPNRKLAIIKNNYKYIYNKKSNREELYDLKHDPAENVNLLDYVIKDLDRKQNYSLKEIYYYPQWETVDSIINELRSEKNKVWRNGTFSEEFMSKASDLLLPYLRIIRNINCLKHMSSRKQ